jgi:uncharacterized protein YggE
MFQNRSVRSAGMLGGSLILLISLALGACAPQAVASGVGGEAPGQTITVTGMGEAYGDPDTAQIQLGVSVRDENVASAVDSANEVVQSVTDALVGLGIDEVDIQTTNYSVWPEDVYDPATGRQTGERIFHVDSTVNVIVRDVSRMSDVIATGLEAGANNIYGISFSIEDTAPLAEQARENALQDAAARAQALAEGMGLTLGKVVSVTEYGGGGITSRVQEAAAAEGLGGGAAPPISPGQTGVSVQVQVVYEISQ